MNDETRLDGNSVGGLLYEMFGREMTGQMGECANCGAVNALGAVHVYRDAPGDVMRCPACGYVLIVITPFETRYRVSFEAIRWIEVTAQAPQS